MQFEKKVHVINLKLRFYIISQEYDSLNTSHKVQNQNKPKFKSNTYRKDLKFFGSKKIWHVFG